MEVYLSFSHHMLCTTFLTSATCVFRGKKVETSLAFQDSAECSDCELL